MRRNLSGRKLVITGAARGIGEKVARLAASRGARVALIGLEPDRLRALEADLGAGAALDEALRGPGHSDPSSVRSRRWEDMTKSGRAPKTARAQALRPMPQSLRLHVTAPRNFRLLE